MKDFKIANPMSVGEFLKEAYLKPLAISNTELATRLGVTPATVSRLVNGKSELTCEMAVRLSKVFKRTAEAWMNIQISHGVYKAKVKLSENQAD